jgi:N-acetylglucosaminyldiphosphoundecaprenol N-acetyl-beta-D-mannosaminyltransferase
MSNHVLDVGNGPGKGLSVERRNVGALRFVVKTPDEAAFFLCRLAKSQFKSREGFHVHLANAYTVALADKDRDFRELLGEPAINFPDGKPIALVSRASGHRRPLRQVRGPDLFENVMNYGRADGVKHFLLGSTNDVLESLETALTSRYEGLNIVGKESPPFRPMSEEELCEQDKRIETSGAEIVWVGLGTPKQDYEVKRIADRMPVVAIAVGAAFDFSAGTLAVAPIWVQRTGLEWLHRFIKEPRRLWKRYLFGNVRFIGCVIRSSFRRL